MHSLNTRIYLLNFLVLIHEIKWRQLLWLQLLLNLRLSRRHPSLWIKTLLRLAFNTYIPGKIRFVFDLLNNSIELLYLNIFWFLFWLYLIWRCLGRTMLLYMKHLFNTGCQFCKIIRYTSDCWLFCLFSHLQKFSCRIKIIILNCFYLIFII